MATIETGTQILARARIIAGDNDANGNYAVGAATALILLNEVLVAQSNNVTTKPKWISATTSGLTFSSGTSSVVTAFITTDDLITEIGSFHQSNSSTFTPPASPPIQIVSVQEILDKLNFDGDNTLLGSSDRWTHVAAEKAQDVVSGADTAYVEQWRVWAFPVINRTRYMHIRASVPVTISAITKTPNIDGVDTRVTSRLLAYEIAKLKKETSQQFLSNILAGVPREALPQSYGAAARKGQLQHHIIEVRD